MSQPKWKLSFSAGGSGYGETEHGASAPLCSDNDLIQMMDRGAGKCGSEVRPPLSEHEVLAYRFKREVSEYSVIATVTESYRNEAHVWLLYTMNPNTLQGKPKPEILGSASGPDQPEVEAAGLVCRDGAVSVC